LNRWPRATTYVGAGPDIAPNWSFTEHFPMRPWEPDPAHLPCSEALSRPGNLCRSGAAPGKAAPLIGRVDIASDLRKYVGPGDRVPVRRKPLWRHEIGFEDRGAHQEP